MSKLRTSSDCSTERYLPAPPPYIDCDSSHFSLSGAAVLVYAVFVSVIIPARVSAQSDHRHITST